jgi:hypothetical protein
MLRVKSNHFHKIAIKISCFACLHFAALRKRHTSQKILMIAQLISEKMARISLYNNDKTEESIRTIEKIIQLSESINLESIEKFQLDYGISDAYMSQLIGISKGQYSGIKTGKNALNQSTRISITLAIEFFKSSNTQL